MPPSVTATAVENENEHGETQALPSLGSAGDVHRIDTLERIEAHQLGSYVLKLIRRSSVVNLNNYSLFLRSAGCQRNYEAE